MNTNWAKILLFSLISFALGFVICRLCGSGCRGGDCERIGGHHEMASACAHSGEGHTCCARSKEHGPMRAHHPGDAEADAIVKELEKADFMGDTTIAIDGGEVHVVRTADNLSVHVDLIGDEHIEKKVEVREQLEHR